MVLATPYAVDNDPLKGLKMAAKTSHMTEKHVLFLYLWEDKGYVVLFFISRLMMVTKTTQVKLLFCALLQNICQCVVFKCTYDDQTGCQWNEWLLGFSLLAEQIQFSLC